MKKVYEKPRAMVEYFTLAQNVAALSCGYNDEDFKGCPTHSDKNQCGWKPDADYDFGVVYWTSTDKGCSGSFPEDMTGAEVCYNSPAGLPMIFASQLEKDQKSIFANVGGLPHCLCVWQPPDVKKEMKMQLKERQDQ